MNTYAVSYTYVTDQPEKQTEIRPVHVEFLKDAFESGRLRISGPVDSGSGALLIIGAESEEDTLTLMDQDPFMQAGLIAERGIRQWNVFFGKEKL